MTSFTLRRLALLAFACVSAFTLLVSACGGGDDDDDATTDVPTSTEESEATTEPGDDMGDDDDGATGGDSVEVNETVWHSGYKLSLGTATFTLQDFGGGLLTIEAEFENLGSADNATFDSRLAVRSGGTESTEVATFDEDIPALPAKGKADGVIAMNVDEVFTFDDATLIIGHPDNNQAIVPLGPNSEDGLITLEPQELAIAGQATAGPIVFDIEGGELRADLPDKYDIADAEHLELRLFFSATPGSGISIGEGVLQSQHVKLRTPEGITIAVREDGVSGVNELLQGNEGTTISDLSVRFEIEKPVAGEYALIFTGLWGPDRTEVEGEMPFEIAEQTVFEE